MGTIHTKRWDDPTEPSDGTRILVCRYRPRGLPKSEETWTEWYADLGPSKALHAAAYGKTAAGADWNTYRVTYLREMKQATQLIDSLAKRVAAGETVTLLCSTQCTRENRCHRSLLKELIERRIASNKPN